MAEFPAMPLWTDAYIADTAHLSDAEHGRYLMMLQHMWRAPNRRFPNDDQWLARKFTRTVEEVREQLRPLILEFFKTDGNWIFHGRIEREWAHVSASRQKQSARSKSRWNKDNDESRGNASVALPPQPQPQPQHLEESPPPPLVLEAPVSPPPKRAKPVPVKAEPDGFAEFYQAYPKHVGRPDAAKAYRAALARASPDEIMAGLRLAIPLWSDPQFIPHPSTWLNKGRWMDEISPSRPTNGNGHHQPQKAADPFADRKLREKAEWQAWGEGLKTDSPERTERVQQLIREMSNAH